VRDEKATMQTTSTMSKALVLGGGGVTGVAWELGVLTGLRDSGLDLRDADLVVGTSAGSVVGAQITSGIDLDDLFNAQLVPPEQTAERAMPFDAAAAFGQWLSAGPMEPQTLRARIGAFALASATVPEAERRTIIASRLPVHEWPAHPVLLIVAVDTLSGQERIFDRASGVSLVDAVGASCAVPGIWPPVTIDGHRYMDGGMRSVNNADLARGCRYAVILSPIGMMDLGPLGNPQGEVALLEREGAPVAVVTPDAASVQAIGPNVLDPAARVASARAGRDQGRGLAGALRAVWVDS
jgi:NTE family protein